MAEWHVVDRNLWHIIWIQEVYVDVTDWWLLFVWFCCFSVLEGGVCDNLKSNIESMRKFIQIQRHRDRESENERDPIWKLQAVTIHLWFENSEGSRTCTKLEGVPRINRVMKTRLRKSVTKPRSTRPALNWWTIVSCKVAKHHNSQTLVF